MILTAAERESIKADPLATEEAVRRLSVSEALQHPNCPVDLWWQLASRQPIDAMASPLYALLMLESPERWEEREKTFRHVWTKNAVKSLSTPQQHLYAADCAQHVLFYWEGECPKDLRPRLAIEARRAYVQNKITGLAFLNALAAGAQAGNGLREGRDAHTAAMLEHVTLAVAVEKPSDVMWQAANVAGCAAQRGLGKTPTAKRVEETGRHNEQKWQWKLAQLYAKGMF